MCVCVTHGMPSSCTRKMDTTNPMAIVLDDIVSSEHEVYISDTTGTDNDDFQPLLRCLMS